MSLSHQLPPVHSECASIQNGGITRVRGEFGLRGPFSPSPPDNVTREPQLAPLGTGLFGGVDTYPLGTRQRASQNNFLDEPPVSVKHTVP